MARRPRRNAAAGVGPDCFSNLNEDLLRLILSRLPTSSAATLAAVSRHFHNEIPRLLERVDSLTLNEPDIPANGPHIQILRANPPILLRRLALAPHRDIPPSSFRWILKDVAQHGVSELSFRLSRRARVPKNVLSLKSVSVLSLDTCAVPPWSNVGCPCLRTLRLHRVAIHQEIINKILASASCLDTLEMVYCTGLGTGRTGSCTVESSSVRNLVFKPTLKLAQITIRAPALRTVTLYTRGKVKRLELGPAPDVRKVYLQITKPRTVMELFRVRPFLDAGVRLQCLTLRGHAIKVLSSEYEEIPKLTVMFQDLRILSVSLDLSSIQETGFLLKLLESCHNLHKFTISVLSSEYEEIPKLTVMFQDLRILSVSLDLSSIQETGFLLKLLESCHNLHKFTISAAKTDEEALPSSTNLKERLASVSCLTTSLVQFKFRGFKPEEFQKELMGFLLTRGKKLKKVGVEFDKSQADAVKAILSVRRASIERISTKYANQHMEMEFF